VTTTSTLLANALWQQGYKWEDLVAALRAAGFTKIDCIRVAVELLRLPLAEAKRIVHFSPTWSDRRADDDAFHELAVTAVAAWGSDPGHSGVVEAELRPQQVAERLVGVVTALRANDTEYARAIIAELLSAQDATHVVLLSGALTAALAGMAQIQDENLVAALGELVATGVLSSGPDTAEAMARAEVALADH
jgi:hypothetical protein